MNGLKREFKVDDTGASEATKSELGQTDSKLVSIQAPIVIPQNKSIKVPELKFVYYEKATKGPGAKNDTSESPGCFNQILTFESRKWSPVATF